MACSMASMATGVVTELGGVGHADGSGFEAGVNEGLWMLGPG